MGDLWAKYKNLHKFSALILQDSMKLKIYHLCASCVVK